MTTGLKVKVLTAIEYQDGDSMRGIAPFYGGMGMNKPFLRESSNDTGG
jgi:hypothetical protein